MYDEEEKVFSTDEDEMADDFDGETFPGLDDDLVDEDEPLNIGIKVEAEEGEVMEEVE